MLLDITTNMLIHLNVLFIYDYGSLFSQRAYMVY